MVLLSIMKLNYANSIPLKIFKESADLNPRCVMGEGGLWYNAILDNT